jgi:hypothetical protein
MRQRGRKGIAQIETAGAVMVITRPDAPLDLTPDETDEWCAIVDAMPADWFARETWPLLAQFCRHTVTSRRVGQLIDAEMAQTEMDLRNLDKLTQMQARETSALKALAASMRLSQQSTWNAKSGDTAKAKRTVKRLWDG